MLRAMHSRYLKVFRPLGLCPLAPNRTPKGQIVGESTRIRYGVITLGVKERAEDTVERSQFFLARPKLLEMYMNSRGLKPTGVNRCPHRVGFHHPNANKLRLIALEWFLFLIPSYHTPRGGGGGGGSRRGSCCCYCCCCCRQCLKSKKQARTWFTCTQYFSSHEN